jgi:hypothetical protein
MVQSSIARTHQVLVSLHIYVEKSTSKHLQTKENKNLTQIVLFTKVFILYHVVSPSIVKFLLGTAIVKYCVGIAQYSCASLSIFIFMYICRI